MKLEINEDLRTICQQIVAKQKSVDEWTEIESDDMFQLGSFTGGFDATEEEFCFETFMDGKEYWFQFGLEAAVKIAKGEDPGVEIRLAE
jgi:hypothetical protein